MGTGSQGGPPGDRKGSVEGVVGNGVGADDTVQAHPESQGCAPSDQLKAGTASATFNFYGMGQAHVVE